jgi:hypothetical protein
MLKHAQIPFVSAFQWPPRHDVAFMVAHPYLVKNTGIISMAVAQKKPEKKLKKLMLNSVI